MKEGYYLVTEEGNILGMTELPELNWFQKVLVKISPRYKRRKIIIVPIEN